MKTILIFIIIYSTTCAFSQNTFFKVYNDYTANFPGDILELESGNFMLSVISMTDTSWNPVLYKFNWLGDTIKTVKAINNENNYAWIMKLHEVGNDKILAFGSSYNNNTTFYDLWVSLLDTSYNLIDEHYYHTGLMAINMLNSLTDCWGNIIVFCSEKGIQSNNSHNFIFRFNQYGDSLFAKIYDTQNIHYAYDLLQAKDSSGFFLFSLWPGLNPGTAKTTIVKINNDFVIDKIVGHTNNIANNSTEWYNDTSFISSGLKTSSSDTVYRIGVSIIDTSGNILNNYYWGRPDTIFQPTVLNNLGFHDGKIYFAGNYNIHSPPIPPSDVTWLVLNVLDSDFNLIWQKFIGGDQFYELYSIRVLDDGSCLMAGHVNDFLSGDDNLSVFLAKIGPNGEFLSSPETPQSLMEVKLYPNPGSSYFMLDVRLPEQKNQIELYDLNGKHCLSQEINNGSNTINTQSLPSGMYVFKIIGKKKNLLSGKWVKN